MPGQIGADPTGGLPPGEDEGNPFAEDEGEEEAPEEEAEEDGGNPFAKGSMLRTASGQVLPIEDYLAHLALRHTDDREATLALVRARRGR